MFESKRLLVSLLFLTSSAVAMIKEENENPLSLPSLRDLSADVVVEQLHALLASNPNALPALLVNDESFQELLKKKILESQLISPCGDYFETEGKITTFSIIDAESQIIAAAVKNENAPFDKNELQILDIKNKKILKKIALPKENEYSIEEILQLSPTVLVLRNNVNCITVVDIEKNTLTRLNEQFNNFHYEFYNSYRGATYEEYCHLCAINENQFAYYSTLKEISIWDVQKSCCVQKVAIDQELKAMRFVAPDTLYILTKTGRWLIWDLKTSSLVESIDNEDHEKIIALYKAFPELLTVKFPGNKNLFCLFIPPEIKARIEKCATIETMKEDSTSVSYIAADSNYIYSLHERSRMRFDDQQQNVLCVKQLDEHHFISTSADNTLRIWRIPHTYNLKELLEILQKNVNEVVTPAFKDRAVAHSSIASDALFLAQCLIPYKQLINEKQDEKGKVFFCWELLDNKIQTLVPKRTKTHGQRVAYFANLAKVSRSLGNKELTSLSIFYLCKELPALSVDQVKALPIDLFDYDCICCASYDGNMIFLPAWIAYQSRVLETMFNGNFKEAREKVVSTIEPYDSVTLEMLKMLLIFYFENYVGILEGGLIISGLKFNPLLHLPVSAQECCLLLEKIYEKSNEIPLAIFPLLFEWNIPGKEFFVWSIIHYMQKSPGTLSTLRKELDPLYYHCLLPILGEPIRELLPLQLTLLMQEKKTSDDPKKLNDLIQTYSNFIKENH